MIQDETLWPEDAQGVTLDAGPDYDLAVTLLAAGKSQTYIRTKCGFESQRQVQAFCRDDETRARVAEIARERVAQLGKRATVCLEEILDAPQTDLRAHVLAIRTALEVAGDLKRDHAAPAKKVTELSVSELNELIAATRSELEQRTGVRQKSDVRLIAAKK